MATDNTAAPAAAAFNNLQKKCKQLFQQSKDAEAMGAWKQGCAACRGTLTDKDWFMHQRDFIRDLKSSNLDDAATAVHAYLYANLPPIEDLYKRSAASLAQSSSSEKTSEVSVHELEHDLLNRSNRAETFGPQPRRPTMTHGGDAPAKETVSAPVVPRVAKGRVDDKVSDKDNRVDDAAAARPPAAQERSKTMPVQKQSRIEEWTGTLKKRFIG
ncbi:hypothetical protein QBC39DRAFT_345464 [Podospora conica]|nr:hypothetical protein QBC39DRAFT_345464 [Schizothecium conicum]